MRVLFLVSFLAVTACSMVRPAWSVSQAVDQTRRTTTEGEVIGGAGKHGGFAWLGIPFAAPPVGELRWRAPQAPARHGPPLMATRYAHACAQPDNGLTLNEPEHDGMMGEEDCLYLNVWAPEQAKGLPVMVWIHGGGNSIGGASSYDLSTLATKQQVIAVTVQYRLGPFGWLRHPSLATEGDASGNYGTLDLVRALEWVRDNAAAFGGDSGNVTVFGESAGGTNTYSLLLSPRAKGLFHRAIAQSPTVSRSTLELAEHDHPNASNEVLLRLLQKRGAADRASAQAKLAAMQPAEVAALFRSVPAQELLALYKEGAPTTGSMLDFPALFPDGEVLPKETWVEAFGRDGGWNRVPVITGSNRDEMKLFQFLDPRYTWRLFGLLPRMRDEEKYQRAASAVSRLWRGSTVDAVATAMRQSGAAEVWSYRFDWDEEPTVLGTDLSKMMGAAHGMEIPFVQGNFDGQLARFFGGEVNPSRDALSARMMNEWCTFARDGRPGPDWTSYDISSDEAPRYMTFDTPLEKVKMTAGVEKPEVFVDALLADATTPLEEKCEGLNRLVRVGFIAAESAAKMPQCAQKGR
jgi:para-nitrobenzyl esterase